MQHLQPFPLHALRKRVREDELSDRPRPKALKLQGLNKALAKAMAIFGRKFRPWPSLRASRSPTRTMVENPLWDYFWRGPKQNSSMYMSYCKGCVAMELEKTGTTASTLTQDTAAFKAEVPTPAAQVQSDYVPSAPVATSTSGEELSVDEASSHRYSSPEPTMNTWNGNLDFDSLIYDLPAINTDGNWYFLQDPSLGSFLSTYNPASDPTLFMHSNTSTTSHAYPEDPTQNFTDIYGLRVLTSTPYLDAPLPILPPPPPESPCAPSPVVQQVSEPGSSAPRSRRGRQEVDEANIIHTTRTRVPSARKRGADDDDEADVTARPPKKSKGKHHQRDRGRRQWPPWHVGNQCAAFAANVLGLGECAVFARNVQCLKIDVPCELGLSRRSGRRKMMNSRSIKILWRHGIYRETWRLSGAVINVVNSQSTQPELAHLAHFFFGPLPPDAQKGIYIQQVVFSLYSKCYVQKEHLWNWIPPLKPSQNWSPPL
ncbi:hypothetical protein B0H10DRAFT_1960903 [Mycena sp. CBHHK59/15]|nr:hypothetical protein B0H10DRAFT_1960903 [Mycena sp. CBHHK59/15]